MDHTSSQPVEPGPPAGGAPTPPSAPAADSSTAWVKRVAHELLGMLVILGLGLLLMVPVVQSFKKEKLALEHERKATGFTVAPVPVVVTELQAVPVADTIHLPGIVEPYQDITLAAEVCGRVVERPVADGAPVHKGDTLLVLDDSDYRIALDRAKARLDLTDAELKRVEKLAKEKVVPPSEVDGAVNAFKQAQADAAAAALSLSRCRIASPIDGEVNDIEPELGELLQVGDKVAEVVDIHRVKLEVGIPERDVDAVRRVSECDVRVDAVKGGLTLRGRKTYLSLKPQDLSRVYTLRLELENPEGVLRPGMFIDATVLKETRPNSLLVPMFAVIPDENGHSVFVVEPAPAAATAPTAGAAAPGRTVETGTPGVARRRRVELGVIQGAQIEILAGLKPGDRLIVMGQRAVAEGAPVVITRTVQDVAELAR